MRAEESRALTLVFTLESLKGGGTSLSRAPIHQNS
jgi:hypothetical protein